MLRTTSLLTLHQKWPGLAQGFELTRARTVKGRTAVAVVHGITSLRAEEADARRLLAIVRGHWRVENCLHWVRDVTQGEDACRVRKGSAPQVLAALRNAVIHLLAEVAAPSRAAAIRGASRPGRKRPSTSCTPPTLNNGTALSCAPLGLARRGRSRYKGAPGPLGQEGASRGRQRRRPGGRDVQAHQDLPEPPDCPQ